MPSKVNTLTGGGLQPSVANVNKPTRHQALPSNNKNDNSINKKT